MFRLWSSIFDRDKSRDFRSAPGNTERNTGVEVLRRGQPAYFPAARSVEWQESLACRRQERSVDYAFGENGFSRHAIV